MNTSGAPAESYPRGLAKGYSYAHHGLDPHSVLNPLRGGTGRCRVNSSLMPYAKADLLYYPDSICKYILFPSDIQDASLTSLPSKDINEWERDHYQKIYSCL
jgi:hypothetical protein